MKFKTFQKSLINYLNTFQFKEEPVPINLYDKDLQPIPLVNSERAKAKRRAGNIIFKARLLVNKAIRNGLTYVRLITLTFRDDADFHPEKLKRFLKSLKNHFNRAKQEYLYFAVYELGKKSKRLHIHIVFYAKPGPLAYKVFTHKYLQQLWDCGYVFISKRRAKIRTAVQYAVKYVMKQLEENYVIQQAFKAFGRGYRSTLYSWLLLFRKGIRSISQRLQNDGVIICDRNTFVRFVYTEKQKRLVEVYDTLSGIDF